MLDGKIRRAGAERLGRDAEKLGAKFVSSTSGSFKGKALLGKDEIRKKVFVGLDGPATSRSRLDASVQMRASRVCWRRTDMRCLGLV